jgi:hypothetical protein
MRQVIRRAWGRSPDAESKPPLADPFPEFVERTGGGREDKSLQPKAGPLRSGSDPHWIDMAVMLWMFLRQLPGLEYPYELGEDPQKTLAEYVAPDGYWTKELEETRLYFACVGKREFEVIYATFRWLRREWLH